ncbi:hypothetical protein H1C71_024126 [Ictidomys tridecemlineatus]|nr:hypothetical protein H1C71_024126 [Ictidomys tridecemlineatus]
MKHPWFQGQLRLCRWLTVNQAAQTELTDGAAQQRRPHEDFPCLSAAGPHVTFCTPAAKYDPYTTFQRSLSPAECNEPQPSSKTLRMLTLGNRMAVAKRNRNPRSKPWVWLNLPNTSGGYLWGKPTTSGERELTTLWDAATG